MKKNKKGSPDKALWRRCLKSSAFKRLKDRAEALRKGEGFLLELSGLKKNHPPYMDPLFKKWPCKTLTYPGAWSAFAEKWHIDLDALIKGEIKSLPYMKIIMSPWTSSKGAILKMESVPGAFLNATEFDGYKFLYLMTQNDFYAKIKDGRGRPRAIMARYIRWRKEYIRRCIKGGEAAWDVATETAERENAEIVRKKLMVPGLTEDKKLRISQREWISAATVFYMMQRTNHNLAKKNFRLNAKHAG